MAEQEVMQRVRHVNECQVLTEAEETLRKCTYEMQATTLKIRTADSGTCLVNNTRQRSLEQLKERIKQFQTEAEKLGTALLNHLESKHPVFGTGRDADSGYCDSQGLEFGSTQLPAPPGATDVRCSFPIQEEGQHSKC
ncbi:hypothetical protein RRG08_032903 [Elysia crispata]|uniref:Uncharacterized protein n=1 Tax=Elysia crispata TaxID=231223 RepID=A0AAE1A7P9_9GAST|nr:hypothetical protein RRG08_032903 [Elysia crispata]